MLTDVLRRLVELGERRRSNELALDELLDQDFDQHVVHLALSEYLHDVVLQAFGSVLVVAYRIDRRYQPRASVCQAFLGHSRRRLSSRACIETAYRHVRPSFCYNCLAAIESFGTRSIVFWIRIEYLNFGCFSTVRYFDARLARLSLRTRDCWSLHLPALAITSLVELLCRPYLTEEPAILLEVLYRFEPRFLLELA